VKFVDKLATSDPIPDLDAMVKSGNRSALLFRANGIGALWLDEPEVSPGDTVSVTSILDRREGDQNIIVYDEYAASNLPTDTPNNVILIPDKRKIANAIAAAHSIRRRASWGARPPKKRRMDQDWDFTTVVIHHSGNRDLKDAKAIQDMHMDPSGPDNFDDIGYQYLIANDGTIFEGRFLAYKGSNVQMANTGKIGILLMGDFQPDWSDGFGMFTDKPTPAQIQSTIDLVGTLKRFFPLNALGGHRDYKHGTECPGDVLYVQMGSLRAATGLGGP